MEQELSPKPKKKEIPKLNLKMKENDEAIPGKKELRQSVNLDEILNQAEDRLIIDPEL